MPSQIIVVLFLTFIINLIEYLGKVLATHFGISLGHRFGNHPGQFSDLI